MKSFCIFIHSSVLLVVTVSICSASSVQGLDNIWSRFEGKPIDTSKGWVTIETIRAQQNRTGDRTIDYCEPSEPDYLNPCNDYTDCVAYNPCTSELTFNLPFFSGLPNVLRYFTFPILTAECSIGGTFEEDWIQFLICFGVSVDCMCTHGAKGMTCGSRSTSNPLDLENWSCIYTKEDATKCDVVPCDPWKTCYDKYLAKYITNNLLVNVLKQFFNCIKAFACEILTQSIQVFECNWFGLPQHPCPTSPGDVPFPGHFVCHSEMVEVHGARYGQCISDSTSIDETKCYYEDLGECSIYKPGNPGCKDLKYCVGCSEKNRPMVDCHKKWQP